MANFYEGNPAFVAVTNTAASSASINDMQNQLALIHNETTTNITTNGNGPTRDHNFDFAWNAVGGYWENAGVANNLIVFPIILPAGHVLTGIQAEVSGATGATAGTAMFGYTTKGGGPTEVALVGAAGNFWDTAGTAYGNALTLTYTIAQAQLPKTITNGVLYYVYFSGPTSGHAAYIWNVEIAHQVPHA